MGGVLAALFSIRKGGQQAPHIKSHCDCTCSSDSSSSSSDATPKPTHHKKETWLEKHRPDIPKVRK